MLVQQLLYFISVLGVDIKALVSRVAVVESIANEMQITQVANLIQTQKIYALHIIKAGL